MHLSSKEYQSQIEFFHSPIVPPGRTSVSSVFASPFLAAEPPATSSAPKLTPTWKGTTFAGIEKQFDIIYIELFSLKNIEYPNVRIVTIGINLLQTLSSAKALSAVV